MNRVGRWVVWGLVLLCLSSGDLKGQAARVWEGTLALPTYALGEEDPNPPFLFGSWPHIYPYARLLDLTQRREVQTYRAFFLENDYLKAIILPDMGGRLYSLFDKVSGREVFYRNHVVKYAPLALRGAWISGGVEFNFPDGHTTTTVSPVYSITRQNQDGSASVLVGNVDQVTGMYWEVRLTLHPRQARLEQGVTLFNSTPTTNLYWYWANAAVRATDDMQFIFPAREMSHESRHRGNSYPIWHRIDYSWYKNVKGSVSLFCRDVHRDFFGAYYHASDYGVAHVADFRQLPGKKYFSWGVAESGLVWTGLLTDDDGPYVEIQSGRYETQLNYDFMPPRHEESWTEYWYPVRGLQGGFVDANRDAALNVVFVPASGEESQHAIVVLCPVVPLRDLRIRVKLGPQTLQTFGPVDLKPLQPQRFSIAVKDPEEARKQLAVEVESADGARLLRWSAADPLDGNPDFVPTVGQPEPPPKPLRQMTVQELFLHGVELEKAHDNLAAARIYEMVLEHDPGYTPALLKQAWREYLAADFPAAESLIKRALARTDSDPAVHYAAGVVYRGAEHWPAAADAFWAAMHYGGPPGPAFAQLGEIALRQQQYAHAVVLLELALHYNPDDVLARADLAAALRLSGKVEDAEREIRLDLEQTELLPFALAEAWRLAGLQGGSGASEAWKRWQQSLTPDVQNYLEVAAWYREVGDLGSSNAVLEAALRALPPRAISPLVYYYLASNARQQGEAARADQFAAQAAAAPYEHVFPRRFGDAEVLREACQKYPADSHAPYYLGNFLFARGHYDDAAALWQRALDAGFSYSVLRRNLGLYAWRVKSDLQGAAGQYERAIQLAPNDYSLYLDLDQIYFQLGDLEARRRLFAGAPAQVVTRDALRVRRARLLIQQRQYDEAMAPLMNHRFTPGEHEIVVRQVFVLANLEKGREKLMADDDAAAEAAFRRGLEYPSNFNIGKPDKPNDQEALYWLGETLQAEGKPEEARAVWQEAVGDGTPATGPARVFQALAMGRLGRPAEAESILAGLAQASAQETASAQDFYVAGVAYRFSDREKEACSSLRRALELDPFLWRARLEMTRCGESK
jgi:tetratricopeptide (TPR) repeat protein